MRHYVFLLSIALLSQATFSACGTAKTQHNSRVANKTKSTALNWQKVDGAKLDRENIGRKIPLKFQAFLIEKQHLEQYFNTIKDNPSGNHFFNVPMPSNIGTLVFPVKDAGTMNEELAKKYPSLVSLSGNLPQSDIRLNYDGNQMTALIHHKGATYLLEPWQTNNTTYYVLYNREDAAEKKVPFEKGER